MKEQLNFYEHVAEVRKIPSSVISDVIVNEQLRFGANPGVTKWLEPDYVLDHAAYFAFATTCGPYRGQTQSMHRGFINESAHTPLTDEFGNAYSIVSSKGTGLSVWSLEQRANNAQLEDRRQRLLEQSDPHGFFGFRHARQDMGISNDLAEGGARVSRGLAILVLNHERFRNWAEPYLADSVYPCFEMMDKVEANGDTAAIIVRMFAANRNPDLRNLNYQTSIDQMRAAAAILSFEIENRGIEQFVQKYYLDQYPNFNVKPLILKIQRETRDGTDFRALKFFQAYFNIWNARIKKNISEKKFDGTLTVQISSQNLDLTGGWSDFETGTKGDPQYSGDSYHPLPFDVMYNKFNFFGDFDERKFVQMKAYSP